MGGNVGSAVLVSATAEASPLRGASGDSAGAGAHEAANKRIVRRLMEQLFCSGRLDLADELIAADYVEHAPLPGQSPGREGLKAALSHFWAAFPDFRLSIDDLIAEGDRVVVRSTATATHGGFFCGVAPTGLRVRWTAIDIIRLADGVQVEHWGNQETLEVLHQLGHAATHVAPGGDASGARV